MMPTPYSTRYHVFRKRSASGSTVSTAVPTTAPTAEPTPPMTSITKKSTAWALLNRSGLT